MPRPEYPSDEARRKSKPAIRVHLSIANHPTYGAVFDDPETRGIIIGLWVIAARAHASKTGDVVSLSRYDLGWCTGRTQYAHALSAMRALCERMSYAMRTRGERIEITIRNFARKQGFAPQSTEHTPHNSAPSESESESESEEEKKIEPSALVLELNSSPSDEKQKDEPITPEELAEAWNEAATQLGLSLVKEIRGSRRKKVTLRLHEHPTPEFWQGVFSALRRSKFLTGQNGKRTGPHATWRASFDWLIENDVNATKVSEGRYV